MTTIVFCGPTIAPAEVRRELDADVRPPAARGDVLRAALDRPDAIVLVDGYFHRVPAVWHKEILWAMSEGIHVFGASSMGALRAAELASFGMEGWGLVFESYRTGVLSDDDEVAVAHATEDEGFRPLSEALVNIRATVRAARDRGVISQTSQVILEDVAKALFYPDRTFSMVLTEAGAAGVPSAEIAAFRQWWPSGRVDQKHEDAVQLLRWVAEREKAGWRPKTVDYTFSHTAAWQALRDAGRVDGFSGVAGRSVVGSEGLVDELLVSGLSASAYNGGAARGLALELAAATGVKIGLEGVRAVAEEFRRERGLLRPEQFEEWLESEHITGYEVDGYFRREAAIRRVMPRVSANLMEHVVDHLRTTGTFGAMSSRAAAKRRGLQRHGLESADARDTQLSDEELWRWYFVERLKQAVPRDLRAYAREAHTDVERLRAAVVREFLYERHCSGGSL